MTNSKPSTPDCNPRVEIGAALRFENLLKEAMRVGPGPEAQKHLAEAQSLIPTHDVRIRPEDDPTRSEADRAAWRLARGA